MGVVVLNMLFKLRRAVCALSVDTHGSHILASNCAHSNQLFCVITPTYWPHDRYDLVNTGREVLAQLAGPIGVNFTTELAKDPLDSALVNSTGRLYVDVLLDVDRLVGTDTAFLLGYDTLCLSLLPPPPLLSHHTCTRTSHNTQCSQHF